MNGTTPVWVVEDATAVEVGVLYWTNAIHSKQN